MTRPAPSAGRDSGSQAQAPGEPRTRQDLTDQTEIWLIPELLETLPMAVYATDAKGLITFCNQAAVDLWGVPPELGKSRWCGAWRLFWPDGQPMRHDECPMAVSLREQRDMRGAEAIAERPDGRRVHFLSYPTLKYGSDGAVVGAVNTLVDITAQKRGQDIAPRMAAIVASSHDAIVSKDLNGIITSWNQSAERVFGYTADEIIGKSVTILIPPDRMEEEPEILRRIGSGEVVDHFETIRLRKDGTRLPISLTISPIRSEDGRVIGVSKIARDITDQKESEQRIRALMREVNHRVKNQFAVILSMIRETNNRAADPAQFERLVRERVMALSRSHDLLVLGDWRGASIFELLLSHIRPFGGEESVTMSGPSLTLQPMAVQYLGIAFHELVMNSARYGVLSGGGGSVKIEWSVEDGQGGEKYFHLRWAERDGSPNPTMGEGGFGRVVLQRVAPAAINGQASLDFGTDSIVWTLQAPLNAVEADSKVTQALREF